MKLAFGGDHAAFTLKAELIEYAKQLGHEVIDLGCHSQESVDYPDYGLAVGKAVANGEADKGVAVCFSGIGISIAANKVRGIRCALCHDPLSARLTREHNDTNVLAMGAGIIGPALAKEILKVWLETAPEGGRHQRRIDKIMTIEQGDNQ